MDTDKCEDFPEQCAKKNCKKQWEACFHNEKCTGDINFCGEHSHDRDSFMGCIFHSDAPLANAAMKCTVDNCCQAQTKKN